MEFHIKMYKPIFLRVPQHYTRKRHFEKPYSGTRYMEQTALDEKYKLVKTYLAKEIPERNCQEKKVTTIN